MTVQRGETWWADRTRSVAPNRPVLAIPLTTNLRRALLPSCVRITQDEGGLTSESVALCHQMRVLDAVRLRSRLGQVSGQTLTEVEKCTLFTMGM